MNDDELKQQLTALETEMHLTETRQNRERMEALLHADFMEFGRSGRHYSRAEILEEMAETVDYREFLRETSS